MFQVKLTPDGFKGNLRAQHDKTIKINPSEYYNTAKSLHGITQELRIHPLKLFEMDASERHEIVTATKTFLADPNTKAEFHSQMSKICKNHRIKFESMRQDTMDKVCQLFGANDPSEIQIGDRRIFESLSNHEKDRLGVVFGNTCDSSPEIIRLAKKFAEHQECASAKEFLSLTEFFVADLAETAKSLRNDYQQALSSAKQESGANFNEQQFAAKHGINGKLNQHFRQEALNKYQGENRDQSYQNLSQRFTKLKEKIMPLNQQVDPRFFGENAATYHYVKHKDFGPMGVVSEEQYFKIAGEIVSPTNRTNAVLSQDGDCVMITYKDTQNGIVGVKIDKWTENGKVSGIATVMYMPDVMLQK
jgi:hypothetical protein